MNSQVEKLKLEQAQAQYAVDKLRSAIILHSRYEERRPEVKGMQAQLTPMVANLNALGARIRALQNSILLQDAEDNRLALGSGFVGFPFSVTREESRRYTNKEIEDAVTAEAKRGCVELQAALKARRFVRIPSPKGYLIVEGYAVCK